MSYFSVFPLSFFSPSFSNVGLCLNSCTLVIVYFVPNCIIVMYVLSFWKSESLKTHLIYFFSPKHKINVIEQLISQPAKVAVTSGGCHWLCVQRARGDTKGLLSGFLLGVWRSRQSWRAMWILFAVLLLENNPFNRMLLYKAWTCSNVRWPPHHGYPKDDAHIIPVPCSGKDGDS